MDQQLKPLQIPQGNHQYAEPLPKSKSRIKLSLSPQGQVEIEADTLNQVDSDFLLAALAESQIRLKTIQTESQRSFDLVCMLAIVSMSAFIMLSSFYLTSKLFQPNARLNINTVLFG